MADMTLKKKPMTREEFLEKWENLQERRERVQQDPRRLVYHLQPPAGWLNDPNGLCQKDGVYHIYHQFVPFYPELCSVLWGHVTTKDFIHYEYQEPALYPDRPWDANGAYSGSTFQQDGVMYVYYTGNVRHEGENLDYITEGREQNTILVISGDGFGFSGKERILGNEDYPEDMSLHVRDPQVFRENGRYYMILGARDRKDRGSALLYESGDLRRWNYRLRFEPRQWFGYMWECPNYLRIKEKQFLIACPQGIRPDHVKYFNTNLCGWFPLNYDFEGTEYEIGDFHPLDRGFDFYAPQVFRDASGRWIMLGWMSTPDAPYDCEQTLEYGWVHAMTAPRELYVNEAGRLCQRPLQELEGMRRDGKKAEFEGEFQGLTEVCFEMELRMERPEAEFRLLLRESVILSYQDGHLSLDMTGCGGGRKVQGVKPLEVRDIHVLSDRSSLEIFVNGGEETFTTRVYDSMEKMQICLHSERARGSLAWWRLSAGK